MIVQIFEVGTAEEAAAIARLGVDHIGVLVGTGKFPREVDYAGTQAIFQAVPPGAKKVALTLSPDLDEVVEIVEAVAPDILHLGTVPDCLRPDEMKELRKRCPRPEIMRTIPVRGEEALGLAREFAPISDYLLLDTQDPGEPQIGATGRTHDWSVSRRIVEDAGCRVVLAGGLGPENAAEAVRRVGPFGVDSKTRTDREEGRGKDLDRVKRFCEAARSAV